MRHYRSMWTVLVLVLCALLLAGCGGDSDNSGDKSGPASTPAPTPIPVDQLTAVSVTEHDLFAGPGTSSAYLAPDGAHFAHWGGDTITIYTAAGEMVSEVLLEDHMRRADSESIRWLPDSRHLVLTNEWRSSMYDPDIYLIDAVTAEIRNLTDDQVDRLPYRDSEVTWEDVLWDVAPRGIDGGERILFVRNTRPGEEFDPPALMTIRPDGSDLTQVGTI
ncbi:MAG: hypothetical protein JW910_13835, partial [Anaerolineae bacterium]|nr:hypothetical protein [Anaerolineae bacterium]